MGKSLKKFVCEMSKEFLNNNDKLKLERLNYMKKYEPLIKIEEEKLVGIYTKY